MTEAQRRAEHALRCLRELKARLKRFVSGEPEPEERESIVEEAGITCPSCDASMELRGEVEVWRVCPACGYRERS